MFLFYPSASKEYDRYVDLQEAADHAFTLGLPEEATKLQEKANKAYTAYKFAAGFLSDEEH